MMYQPPAVHGIQFHEPTSVTSDGTRLYLADSGNNRVLIWNRIPKDGKTSPDVVLGQHDLMGYLPNQDGVSGHAGAHQSGAAGFAVARDHASAGACGHAGARGHRAHRKLGDFRKAKQFFTQYLEADKEISAEMKGGIERSIAEFAEQERAANASAASAPRIDLTPPSQQSTARDHTNGY